MISFENYVYDEKRFFSKDAAEKSLEKKLFFLAKLEAKNKLVELCSGLQFDIKKGRFWGSTLKVNYRNKEIKISVGHRFTSKFCEKLGWPSIIIKNTNTNKFLFKKYFPDCENMFTNLLTYKEQIRESLLHNKEFLNE